MDNITAIKAAVAAVTGALTGLWGWMGWLVVGWIICMVLDYITGSAAAAKGGAWSSAKAREGIWHKTGMIVVVIVAAGADLLLATVLAHLPVIQLPVEFSVVHHHGAGQHGRECGGDGRAGALLAALSAGGGPGRGGQRGE